MLCSRGVINDLCGETANPSPPPGLPAEPPASPQPAPDSVIEDLELKEMNLMLESVINDLCGETANPSPPPGLPAGPPASPQPAAENPPAIVQLFPPLSAPPTTVPAQLYSQPVTGSQEQTLLYHWPVSSIPTAATAPPAAPAFPAAPSLPAAPANPINNVLQIPDSMLPYLRPVGVLNGVLVCDFAPSCPAVNTPTPKKRKRQDEQEEQHIKKPPNAFMIFLKEQRAKVKEEMNISGNATLNAVMGERWKSLSSDQQAKYNEQAEQERRLHAQKYPYWSAKVNYGKKRRGRRSSTCSSASVSEAVAIRPQIEASFFGATGEAPPSVHENFGPLLPATQDHYFLPQTPPQAPSLPAAPANYFLPQTPADPSPFTSIHISGPCYSTL